MIPTGKFILCNDHPKLVSKYGSRRFVRVLSPLVLLTLGAALETGGLAQGLLPGFGHQTVFSGLTAPTAVEFAKDGRVFVAEKSGLIRIFPTLTATASTIFADLRANVNSRGTGGLLGMVLDPNFPTKPYVYVLYSYGGTESGGAPAAGGSCVPGAGDNCTASGRLSRLRASGNLMTGPEQTLIPDWHQRYPGQPVGGIAFGPDGALYASVGSGSLKTQSVRAPLDPVALSGSVVRVNADTGAPLPRATSMVVGAPTSDAHGVKSYSVISAFQGPTPTVVRVLEPTNPEPGRPRRFLYVLPVDAGLTTLDSVYSDGLEELRLLNIPNRYNLTLIAPSFNIEPWYGDHATDTKRWLESFVIRDLVPFGDSFASPGAIPERWVIGFSKSGNGALLLTFRNPNVFSQTAAWDAPAQFTDISEFDMTGNFGTEENFAHYAIPALVATRAKPFRTKNRIWISGDDAAWTADMVQLHRQMMQAGVLHTWAQGVTRVHSWKSGWLEGAVAAMDANASNEIPIDAYEQRTISYGLRSPSHFTFRPGTQEMWIADKGLNDWEEINRISNAGDGIVENFGWPCYEGDAPTSYSTLDICSQLRSRSAAATAPYYKYQHHQEVVAGEGAAGNGSISGMAFYGTGAYPATYQGALFFSDYARNRIWVMFRGSNGLPDSANVATFVSGASGPVDLKIGPGGDLYYVDMDGGAIRRVIYVAPIRLNAQRLPAGTTQTTLSLATVNKATCRYANIGGIPYESMPSTFSTTGGTAHSTTVTGLTDGWTYTFNVRCQDGDGNANPDDFVISFSVAQPEKHDDSVSPPSAKRRGILRHGESKPATLSDAH